MEKIKRVSEAPKPKVISINMDAAFFFERAVQSLDRFHYDKALKYFRRAAEYEQDNPVNHCNLAGVLSEMGNYDESNQILQHILEYHRSRDDGMSLLYGKQLCQHGKFRAGRTSIGSVFGELTRQVNSWTNPKK